MQMIAAADADTHCERGDSRPLSSPRSNGVRERTKELTKF